MANLVATSLSFSTTNHSSAIAVVKEGREQVSIACLSMNGSG